MRRTVAALGVLVVLVGFVAWRARADRPPPPVAPTDDAVRAAVEADPGAAEGVGRHLLDTMVPGGCLPPDSPELGPLAGVGGWTHVCVLGAPDGSFRQAKSDWVAGGVAIAFGGRSLSEPDICFRTVAGRWMEWYPAAVNPAQRCADGWTFQGA